VPKATVNEQDGASLRKYKVWTARQILPVQSVAVTHPMERTSNG
jgi:hypothetical protein